MGKKTDTIYRGKTKTVARERRRKKAENVRRPAVLRAGGGGEVKKRPNARDAIHDCSARNAATD